MSAPSFTLKQQILEVENEIAMRREVYGRRVRDCKMRQEEADYKIARMEAVLKTLQLSAAIAGELEKERG